MKIPILYEDNHLLVVEKPPRMPVQGDESGDMDLLTVLKADIKERYQKPGFVFLGLVQRLDRPVGGVMVFGRTTKAAGRLAEQVRERTLEKEYRAVLIGKPPEPRGTMRHFLRKNPTSLNVEIVAPGVTGAKEAILSYETLDYRAGLTLVKVKLETGRSHQIRVQMAALGTPLFGDMRYGAEENRAYMERLKEYRERKLGDEGDGDKDREIVEAEAGKEGHREVALWSYRLSLTHPTKQERMTFLCPPPDKFPFVLFEFGVVGK